LTIVEYENVNFNLTFAPSHGIRWGNYDEEGLLFTVTASCFPGRPGSVSCKDETSFNAAIEAVSAQNPMHRTILVDPDSAAGIPGECPDGC
jgi:hypothetical protein